MTGRDVTLLVNPAAGRGRGRRRLPAVSAALADALGGRPLRVHRAADYADAARVAARAVEAAVDGGCLVVMGGDGMAALGLNACAGTNVPLGIIPTGTGNDFCRGAGLATSIPGAVDAITGGWTRRVDLMSVSGDLSDGSDHRYVGSVVSSGFDERVNRRTNNLPVSVGTASYLFSVIAELRSFRPLRYELNIDGDIRALDAMLVAVGNSGLFGGGMRICPDADVHDGLLDVTIIHPVSRSLLLRLLPLVFTGGFVGHPAVELLRARRVVVDGPGLMGMADGESRTPPFTCTAVPGAVSVFSPRGAVWPGGRRASA